MDERLSILAIESVFPPDPLGRLRYEFAKELASRGNRIVVIVPFPPECFTLHDKSHSRRKSLHQLFNWERLGNLLVLRVVPRKMSGETFLSKVAEHLLTPISLSASALTFSRNADIVHCSSPPLLSAFGACLVSAIRHLPLVVRYHDLHPDALVKMGLLRNRIAVSMLEIIEKFVYLRADKITVISPAYKSHIVSRGIPPERIEVIPNWYQPSETAMRGEYESLMPQIAAKIKGKIVFTYAGSLYWAQDLETVIDAAHLLREKEDLVFLIVGEGPKRREIVERAKKLNLRNVFFLPVQRRKVYLQIVSASRACLVTLSKNYTSPTLPSKVPELMGLGKPIIANAPVSSEVTEVIAKASCGLVVEPGDPEAFAEAVLALSEDERFATESGKNGRAFAEENFSPSICLDRYDKTFRSLLSL